MHLIIDGYNLLGARREMMSDPEAARERLLRDLASYHLRKKYPITVVFDGWRQGLATEHHEHRAGVEVIYSRRGERADQVLQRLAAEYGRDCTIVSSDHEVQNVARAHGAFVVGAGTFQSRMELGARGAEPSAGPWGQRGQDDAPARPREKKGNPKKLPKAVRRRNRQLRGF